MAQKVFVTQISNYFADYGQKISSSISNLTHLICKSNFSEEFYFMQVLCKYYINVKPVLVQQEVAESVMLEWSL